MYGGRRIRAVPSVFAGTDGAAWRHRAHGSKRKGTLNGLRGAFSAQRGFELVPEVSHFGQIRVQGYPAHDHTDMIGGSHSVEPSVIAQ